MLGAQRERVLAERHDAGDRQASPRAADLHRGRRQRHGAGAPPAVSRSRAGGGAAAGGAGRRRASEHCAGHLQPHFLFNSLHSIASLARAGDNAGVVRLIAGFSEILRHLLTEAPAPPPLSDEMQLVERYLEIQRVRFADRLQGDDQSLAGRRRRARPAPHSQPLSARRARGRWAHSEYSNEFDKLTNEPQAQLIARLTKLLHTNTYDPATGTITVDPIRVEAFQSNLAHYTEVFSAGSTDYAIPAGAVTDPDRLRKLSAFFFWTSWAASTNRPNDIITYTNNWPHEPLVGNRPTGETVVWTGVSIIMLLAGISAMVWWYASPQRPKRNRRRCRNPTRWAVGRPRRRSRRPSSTSGSCPP